MKSNMDANGTNANMLATLSLAGISASHHHQTSLINTLYIICLLRKNGNVWFFSWIRIRLSLNQ